MSENMSVSVNGQSQVPPGFRFHPTEEELLRYYLRKKVAYEKIDLDVIRDVDLNKLEPWDIQEACRIGSMPQNDWYFFSHKDKKYPTGTRTNRATAAGFWKATGRDKVIYSSCKRIGMRKTLVFYKGRAPHGQKSDWIMHEYRLDDNPPEPTHVSSIGGESGQEDGWVVCRVFKKKNYHKALEAGTQQVPAAISSLMQDTRILMASSSNDGVLDQILAYMGRSCKQEHEMINSSSSSICRNLHNNMQFLNPIKAAAMDNEQGGAKFMHLPGLENPMTSSNNIPPSPLLDSMVVAAEQHHHHQHDQAAAAAATACCTNQDSDCNYTNSVEEYSKSTSGLSDWVALDRLVASQLNGQVEGCKKLPDYYGEHDDEDEMFSFPLNHDDETQLTNPCSNNSNHHQPSCNSEVDIWSFAPSSSSSSDPLGHLSI